MRTINFAFVEQYPRAFEVECIPDFTTVDNTVVLNERYVTAISAVDGTGSLALPTKTTGSIRFTYKIRNRDGSMTTGVLFLSAGTTILFSDLVAAGGTASDSLQEYVDAKVADAVPNGGTTGQVLSKASNADLDTAWADAEGGVPTTRTVNGHALSADVVVTKSDVGLGSVDNTADTAKPVSTAQAAAIAGKQSTLVSGTNIKTVNGTSLLGSGNISAGGASYLVYTALLSQSGTSAPVATVLENTLGGTVVWTRNGPGDYTGTLAAAFTVGKTIIRSGNVHNLDTDIGYLIAPLYDLFDVSNVQIYTVNVDANTSDDIGCSFGISICVYP